MKLFLHLSILLLCGLTLELRAQSGISFNSSYLAGESLIYPTCMAFGPDGRLYVTVQDGQIYAYTIQKNGPNNYQITNTETILLVKQIANHNDKGQLESLSSRQLTGIATAGTAANPILYISSSDQRIGGGGEQGDLNLDTNSGTISKLTKNGSTWTHVLMVQGLPRSEENHAPNGLQLDAVNNILYVAQGGNTNAGSPSNNFAFLTEYALSAAILRIDLNQINNQFGGAYVLPTLDDPTRANIAPGVDVNDPYGGNDGLNQAKLVIGGPVQIWSPGYRNIFDLLITKTPGKAGRMYTVDNGANAGWGGYPENEGQPNVTNNRLLNEPGSTTPTMTDDPVNNMDNLHLITGQGYYGGHPNPLRANPAGAGLYWFDNDTNQGQFSLTPTVDWPPYPVSMADPVQSDFRNPGPANGALWVTPYSTNGLAEYTASNFNGAMRGDLLAASFMGGSIQRIELNEAGDEVTAVTDIFTGFGEFPLDVIAQGDTDPFPGTIWGLTYTDANIVVFEPNSGPTTCTGDNNNFNLDDDGDGYSNGDETLNGTNPCSAASKPKDFDLDLVSDLRDADDDNDGLNDIVDKFAWDANNGRNTTLPLDFPFLNGNPGTGFFGVGVTGLMTNNVDNYAAQYDPLDPALIVGGAVGAFSVPAQPGDATTNNQKYAFQFGFPVSASVSTFTIQSRLLGSPFFNGATGANLGTQSHGIYFGTGDQNNYLKVVLHANNGNPGIQILCEQNGVVVNNQIIPVANIIAGSQLDLFIEVNAISGLVRAKYQTNGAITDVGTPFTVSGNLLSLLQNHTDAVAAGIIASSGNKTSFSATWDYMRITTTALGLYDWQPVQYANGTSPSQRHENGFVEVNGKFYLLGGRGIKPVNIYDPATKIWTSGAPTPIELHHFQAVAFQNKIYAIGALTGAYPTETPVANVYVYDIATNTWSTGATIPAARRRGSSGVVLFNNKFYIVGGIQVGHTSGWVAWVDSYDPVTGTWAQLLNAPQARDHFQAALFNGKIYCAGGRRTSQPNFAANTIGAVDVYDIATNTWTTPTQLPTLRGAPAVAFVNNELIVAGGEVDYTTAALSTVEAYNATANTWATRPSLNVGRHATQMISFGNNLYIAAGSTTQGADGENNTMAVASYPSATTNTPPVIVQTYPNQSVPSTQTTLVVALASIFNDDGGVQNLTFTVPNNTNAALVSNTQVSGTQLTFTLTGTTGTGTITLRATDAANQFVQTTFTLTVTGSGTSTLENVIRINAGGPAQTFGTEAWVADQYFTEGFTYSTPSAISNTTQDQIYQTERFGNFQYHIPVTTAGTYAVDIHLAEIYHTAAGMRVFNINVENGQFVRNNLDLIQTYGPNLQAIVLRADNLNVTDGMIDITFTTVTDNAKVSGIAVGRYTAPANTPPVVIQAYPNQNVLSTQTTLAVPLSSIFNDDGGVQNLTFSVQSNTNAALISNTQISGTQLIFTLSGTTGTGTITLRATDAANQSVQTTFNLTVTPPATPTLTNVIRINAGGSAQTFGTEAWVADQYFTGGFTYSTPSAISNTTQDQIYQTERFGNFQYHIPVTTAGTYAVDLHLAEIYHTAAGMRVFNINVENGQFVRNNLDLIQTYGPNLQAIVLRADNLNVTDGMIDITFTTVTDNAKVSGIAVGRYTAPPTNTPPVVVQPYPNQSVPSTQTTLVVPLTSVFNDDGGVQNLTFSVPSNTNAGLISNTQISGTQLTFTLSGTTGTGTITLRATDAANQSVQTTFALTVTPPATPTLTNVIRINAGGSAQTFGTEAWVADQYFTGGFTYSTPSAISNTTQDQIYQTERFGNFQYHIPVTTAGTYAVDIHLAEIYHTVAGMRVFNINVENGQFVRNNLDLIQTYGADLQAIVLRADNLNVTDGMIDITFTTVTDNAKVSGIAVGRYSTGGSARMSFASNSPLVSTPPSVILNEGKSWSYKVEATDPDGDPLTYSSRNLPASLYLNKQTGEIKGTIEMNAGVYPVELTVTDKGGLSTKTNFTVTVTNLPSTSDVFESNVIVYPNPAQKKFSVKLEAKKKGNWNFVMTDVAGKPTTLGSVDLAEGVQVVDFDLAPHNFSPGMYFLSVTSGQGKKVIKVAIK